MSLKPNLHRQEVDKTVKLIFFGIFLLEVALNYDVGAVPAVLESIKEEFSMDPWMQGLLGGLQYIGLTLTSLFAGLWLQKRDVKTVLNVSLLTNVACCSLFAMSPNQSALLLARAGIGASQTAIIVFAPVWVDQFAPSGSQTMWMSMLQAAVPVGVMLGYVCAGAMVNWIEGLDDGIRAAPAPARRLTCHRDDGASKGQLEGARADLPQEARQVPEPWLRGDGSP